MNTGDIHESAAVILPGLHQSDHLDCDGGVGVPFDLLGLCYADITEAFFSFFFD